MSALFIYSRRCTTISTKELLINDDIRAKEVRLLNEDGDQMGIMSLSEAKGYAEDKGVDLVCIAPQATPPVCRAMDYGKYRYEQDKREKEQKKKQQVLIGFAAETQNLIENATEKVNKKNLDMIVANDVSAAGVGFNADTNIVKFLYADGRLTSLDIMPKTEVANRILDEALLIYKQSRHG